MYQERAWKGESSEDSIKKMVLAGERPKMKDLDFMPKEIADLIVKGWSQNPDDRYSFDWAKPQLNDLLGRQNKK